MLTINIWLIIAAITALSIQSIQLVNVTSRWRFWLAGTLVGMICYFSSDFIAAQNILLWQSFAKTQQQTIQIVVLLELSLAVFLRYKILPISSVLALVYGQLCFFQQGWFNWPFQWQGLLFGLAVLCLAMVNITLSKVEPYWSQLLFYFVLLAAILSAATSSNAVFLVADWQEMLISLFILTSLITMGIAFDKIKKLNKNWKHQ